MLKASLSLSTVLLLLIVSSLWAAQPQPIPPLAPEPLTPNENTHNIDASQRLTIVSGGRVRVKPDSNSGVVATLTLGTVMKQIGRTPEPIMLGGGQAHYWYQVKLSNGKQGWIFGSLTIPYHPSQHLELYRQLVAERMQKNLSFADQMEVTRLIAGLISEVNESTEPAQALIAELEFAHLSSIQKTLRFYNQASTAQRRTDPYRAWIHYLQTTVNNKIFHDEVSSRQLLKPQVLWQLYETYPKLNTLSDEIAWAAAISPAGGECEDDLNCVFSQILEAGLGRYLQLFPKGSHQQDAVKQLGKLFVASKDSFSGDEEQLIQQFDKLQMIFSIVDTPEARKASEQLNSLRKDLLSQ